MPNKKYLEPKEGITSTEAAALYLSDGKTSDMDEANEMYARADPHNFYFDQLDKDHLRKTMGFDFEVIIKNKRLTVYTLTEPRISKTVKFSGVQNDRMIEKLVELCLDVKKMYEEEKQCDSSTLR